MQADIPLCWLFLLAILLIDIPFMLGMMLTKGKKLNGRYSLAGVVLFREKLSWKSFAVVFVAAFVVYVLMMLVTPISTFLADSLFSGLPVGGSARGGDGIQGDHDRPPPGGAGKRRRSP